MNILVNYTNNELKIDGINENNFSNVKNLWDHAYEDYNIWLDKFSKKKYKIIKQFQNFLNGEVHLHGGLVYYLTKIQNMIMNGLKDYK